MNRGFTIVELVIVLAVLSVLTSLVIFGSAAMMEQSRNSEATSEMQVIRSALERYYTNNGEYPSAASLANGGDGRNLSTTQYNTIASTLGINPTVLRGGTYKFVPCAVSGSLCCTMNASNECAMTTADGDSRNIFYMTRTATQATSAAAMTFKAPVSGCTYTLSQTTAAEDLGYSAYFLMYRNFTDGDWWTSWRVYTSDRGMTTRGAWCIVNKFD